MPLPGLVEWDGDVAEIRVLFCDLLSVDTAAFEPVHIWKDLTLQITMSCSRRGNTYLLAFPGVCVFYICPETALIEVLLEDSSQEPEAVRMLLDQVLPRLFFHWRRAVLHASAILTSEGLAVAFLGDTGRGKSTLAGSFYTAGTTILTDDCLLVQAGGSGLEGIPAYSGLRLWSDSVDALGLELLPSAQSSRYHGKYRLEIEQQEPKKLNAQLSALFVLGDPGKAPVGSLIECQQLEGSGAMMALVKSAFLLDPLSVDAVQRNFQLLGQIAGQNVPVYELNYQRNHELLPLVRAKVIDLITKIQREGEAR